MSKEGFYVKDIVKNVVSRNGLNGKKIRKFEISKKKHF